MVWSVGELGIGSVRLVKRGWVSEELIVSWTLVAADWELVVNKAGATKLGFVVLLKFYEIEGRFPGELRRSSNFL